MSNGTEEYKGNQLTQAAFELLRDSGLNFHGNVEGHDLFEGTVDVVVTDGFTGNVVLKTSEALAESLFRLLKKHLTANPVRKAGRAALQTRLSRGQACHQLRRVRRHAAAGSEWRRDHRPRRLLRLSPSRMPCAMRARPSGTN